jgi:hypothetical protein
MTPTVRLIVLLAISGFPVILLCMLVATGRDAESLKLKTLI